MTLTTKNNSRWPPPCEGGFLELVSFAGLEVFGDKLAADYFVVADHDGKVSNFASAVEFVAEFTVGEINIDSFALLAQLVGESEASFVFIFGDR